MFFFVSFFSSNFIAIFQDKQVSISVGDILTITRKYDDGWVKIEKSDGKIGKEETNHHVEKACVLMIRAGLVPSNYCEEFVEEEKKKEQVEPSPKGKNKANGDIYSHTLIVNIKKK